MNLPFFYVESEIAKDGIVTLNEDSSRHIIQVLRMKAGEQLRLTDGMGNSYTGSIQKEHKKINRRHDTQPSLRGAGCNKVNHCYFPH